MHGIDGKTQSTFESFYPPYYGSSMEGAKGLTHRDSSSKTLTHAKSIWNNRPVGRDTALIKTNPKGFTFVGLEANGPACIYGTDGTTVVSAVMFVAGAADPNITASC